MGWTQVEQGFSTFLIIFKNLHSAFGVLHFEKSSKMVKIWQPCSTCKSRSLPKPEPKPDFRKSGPSLDNMQRQPPTTLLQLFAWFIYSSFIIVDDKKNFLWKDKKDFKIFVLQV